MLLLRTIPPIERGNNTSSDSQPTTSLGLRTLRIRPHQELQLLKRQLPHLVRALAVLLLLELELLELLDLLDLRKLVLARFQPDGSSALRLKGDPTSWTTIPAPLLGSILADSSSFES